MLQKKKITEEKLRSVFEFEEAKQSAESSVC